MRSAPNIDKHLAIYLEVSRTFHSAPGSKAMTVEQGMRKLSQILRETKPNSAMYKRVALLLDDIVRNNCSPSIALD